MDDALTLRYDALSDSHFWLTSKAYVIDTFLEPYFQKAGTMDRILEIGCCAGKFLGKLKGRAHHLYGLDMSHSALKRCRDRSPFIHTVRADGLRLPYAPESFDMVIMQDVLEHIPDDEGTLRMLHEVSKPEALCFICVPAYMFLYGHHDELFGHVRRYTRRELTTKLRANGFDILRATYFQSPFLAPLYVKRRFGKKDGDDFLVPPKPVNAAFDALLKCEALPMRFMNIPFGPTLMCMARRSG